MAAGLSRTHGDDELRGADGEDGSYADGSYAAQEAEGVAGRFAGASGKFGSAGMMHSSLGGKGLTSTPEGLSVTPEASAMQDGVIIGGYDTQVSRAMPTRLSRARATPKEGGAQPRRILTRTRPAFCRSGWQSSSSLPHYTGSTRRTWARPEQNPRPALCGAHS